MADGRAALARVLLRARARVIGPLLAGFQRTRRDQLAMLPPATGRVVMLGDSITAGGEWVELLDGLPAVNRGVSGETAAQLLERVPLAAHRPQAIALLIGTNDLSTGVAPEHIVQRVARILDAIDAHAPGTPVLLQGVMPRKPRLAPEINRINAGYRRLASTRPSVTYLDLWEALSADGLRLRPDLTFDGLHLNGAGYRAWAAVLRPALARIL